MQQSFLQLEVVFFQDQPLSRPVFFVKRNLQLVLHMVHFQVVHRNLIPVICTASRLGIIFSHGIALGVVFCEIHAQYFVV